MFVETFSVIFQKTMISSCPISGVTIMTHNGMYEEPTEALYHHDRVLRERSARIHVLDARTEASQVSLNSISACTLVA